MAQRDQTEFIADQVGIVQDSKRDHVAARNKVDDKGIKIKIINDEDRFSSNELSVTFTDNLVNRLLLQWSVFNSTRDENVCVSMLRTLDLALPLQATSDEVPCGDRAAAFLQVDRQFTLQECELLLAELKICYKTFPNMEPNLVTRIRQLMFDKDLLERLIPSGLPLFLESIQLVVSTHHSDHTICLLVVEVLDQVDLSFKYRFWSSPNRQSALLPEDYREVLMAVQKSVDMGVRLGRLHVDAITKQHGGIQRHHSMEEIMAKTSEVCDVSTLSSLLQQAMCIHAEQLAGTSSAMAEHFEWISKAIAMLLAR